MLSFNLNISSTDWLAEISRFSWRRAVSCLLFVDGSIKPLRKLSIWAIWQVQNWLLLEDAFAFNLHYFVALDVSFLSVTWSWQWNITAAFDVSIWTEQHWVPDMADTCPAVSCWLDVRNPTRAAVATCSAHSVPIFRPDFRPRHVATIDMAGAENDDYTLPSLGAPPDDVVWRHTAQKGNNNYISSRSRVSGLLPRFAGRFTESRAGQSTSNHRSRAAASWPYTVLHALTRVKSTFNDSSCRLLEKYYTFWRTVSFDGSRWHGIAWLASDKSTVASLRDCPCALPFHDADTPRQRRTSSYCFPAFSE